MREKASLVPIGIYSELGENSFMLLQNEETYKLAGSRYESFYRDYILPRIKMYRGWLAGYHDTESNIVPTLLLQKIGKGIVSILFNKPVILNAENEETNAVTNKEYKKSKFNQAIKEAYAFAVEGGTALVKWNRDGNNQLKAEALPMDKFFVSVNSYGKIIAVKSFIATYHDTINAQREYYLCEERFFATVTTKTGERKRMPMVHYLFYTTSTNIASENTIQPRNMVWNEIPKNVQEILKADYGDIFIDTQVSSNLQEYKRCKLLPFADDLGCRLLKFTRNIPSFPKLPFGQPIADILMNEFFEWEQLKAFARVEVYIARARILLSKLYTNPEDPDNKHKVLDNLVFDFYDSISTESDNNKPEEFQPDLRAEKIREHKQNILNDIALALNLSSTSIASWLSDGQTQKTATEIECEKSKTASFVNDQVDIIQEPLQELIDIFYNYYGVAPPEVNIVSEVQTIRSESIRLHSELYDKGQITARMLAKEILGTCSNKEIDELTSYIEAQKEIGQVQQQLQPIQEEMV